MPTNNGKPKPPDDNAFKAMIHDMLALRLWGTTDRTDFDNIASYVARLAPTDPDVASVNAGLFTKIIAENSSQHAAGAKIYLDARKSADDELADIRRALGPLTEEFSAHALKLWQFAWADEKPVTTGLDVRLRDLEIGEPQAEESVEIAFRRVGGPSQCIVPIEQDGMLRPDARLITYLSERGEKGKTWAKSLREQAKTRWGEHQKAPSTTIWVMWLDPQRITYPRWLEVLLDVLWIDIVRPQLERETKKPAALTMVVHEKVIELHTPGAKIRPANARGQLLLYNADDEAFGIVQAPTVPTMGLEHVEELIRKGMKHMGGVHGHRLLFWEVCEGHTQKLNGVARPELLITQGGWSEVAEQIGSGASQRDVVRSVALAQAHAYFDFPSWKGNLILCQEFRPKRGQSARIEITLGSVLMADFCFSLPGRTQDTFDKKALVPIVGLPPLIGRDNEHGKQCALRMLVIADMRRRAREMAGEGGIRLDKAAFAALAAKVNLSPQFAHQVLNAWLNGTPDAIEPLLKEVGPDRFTLSDHYRAEREFIESAGKTSELRSKRGKHGVAKRRRTKDGK